MRLGCLPNKVMAAQYQLALPSAAVIEKELAAAIRAIESKQHRK
jgi:hypothetical protein